MNTENIKLIQHIHKNYKGIINKNKSNLIKTTKLQKTD